MFHSIIKNKKKEWLNSPECNVKELLHYIHERGFMRDAQIEAIETYLFLKIECANKPLWQLFFEGKFNTLDLDKISLTLAARKELNANRAAVSLLEYAKANDRNGKQLSSSLEEYISDNKRNIDYEKIFKEIFYGVSYTDYLFSLPMGAGKTYLMAAFIYLDLYFALNEPDNPCFAHNFVILAPSGLKSSILPSLRKIKDFDPSCVIPEPSASRLRQMIKLEILDEQKTAKNSNLIKNPNAQKINMHLSGGGLMGLVAITNAEKVILDRIDKDYNPSLYTREELNNIAGANELRNVIGDIPNLAIYVDEVHHASNSEIRLRQVITEWTKRESFNSMLGFSGTPYLETAEKVVLSDEFVVNSTDLTNIVYHYPLIDGIDNFLKNPSVKYADNDMSDIIRNGVNEFFDKYGDKVYYDGTCAKLAIYCAQIETLEEVVYPMVSELLSARGVDASESILKYHKGNKEYKVSGEAKTVFASLDMPFSKVRVVLLVQIGKEGWDCKSLTGVILPQKGACPTNMVLQTSCRCLRQVEKGSSETALIWMNKSNADTLNKQLKWQQNISITEFSNKKTDKSNRIERYSRMDIMAVPPIDYYQLKVEYKTVFSDESFNAELNLRKCVLPREDSILIYEQDFKSTLKGIHEKQNIENVAVSFTQWLNLIVKESFGTLSLKDINKYKDILFDIFNNITISIDGVRCYNSEYKQGELRANIRKCFVPDRRMNIREELIFETAKLLKEDKLTSPIYTDKIDDYYPEQADVKRIIELDKNPSAAQLSPEALAAIKLLQAQGISVPMVESKDERTQTYHYLPYHFDSGLERTYFVHSVLPIIKDKKLEVYYNGDSSLTNFRINCYKKTSDNWQNIGQYTPDFLLIRRGVEGEIYKVVIIETKGEAYASGFKEKRIFMDSEFIKYNNTRFGYERFSYLYLEDNMGKDKINSLTINAINNLLKD